MKQQQKEYIEKNIDLITYNEWKEFFNEAPSGIGTLLYKAGIDFLSQMDMIPDFSFEDCRYYNLTIPNHILSIGFGAYRYSRLKTITIPDSVTSIDADAFCNCRGLINVTFGANIRTIGSGAFRNCSRLTNINLPDSLTIIGNYTFADCTNLRSVTIPHSVVAIGDYAFSWCENLNTIIYEGSIEEFKTLQTQPEHRRDQEATIRCLDGDLVYKI